MNLYTDVRPITVVDIIIMLFWSIILSIIIATTYRGTHKSVSYSQNFTQSLIILNIIISAVMLIVGTNIARAFTLVGALSIIRFRTAIKDTRDIAFIFFTMVVGMACGTRFYLLAIIVTLLLCSLIYYMSHVQFGKKHIQQDILEVDIPLNENYVDPLKPIFKKYLKYYTILGVESLDPLSNRVSFLITFKSSRANLKFLKFKEKEQNNSLNQRMELLKDLQKVGFINNIKLIEGTNSIEL
ncbi:MAG: DUF4956 domain-containing protein [Promethearchaeota archaeon]